MSQPEKALAGGKRPVGLMDKASASGAGDSRFESWAGHFCIMCARAPQVLPAHIQSTSWHKTLSLQKSPLWDSNPRPPAY